MKIVKRLSLLLLCFFALTILAYAQADSDIGTPNPAQIGVDSAQQKLKEVSVSKFEDAGFWYSAMSMDDGIATLRRFQGSPKDKEPIPGEEEAGIEEQDAYVLGLKIQYFSRGPKVFGIFPVRPLPVEGVTKTISVWVVGRNFNHVLKVILEDSFGNNAEITMGKLNFSGWRKLTVAVPPSLKQRDYHYSNRLGVKVKGFMVETDPAESYGTYYIYFDDMRAVTDLFAEEDRDEDDMMDSW